MRDMSGSASEARALSLQHRAMERKQGTGGMEDENCRGMQKVDGRRPTKSLRGERRRRQGLGLKFSRRRGRSPCGPSPRRRPLSRRRREGSGFNSRTFRGCSTLRFDGLRLAGAPRVEQPAIWRCCSRDGDDGPVMERLNLRGTARDGESERSTVVQERSGRGQKG